MYSYETRVRFSKTDERGLLSPGALFDEFQDCAEYESADRGVGARYLMEHSQGWVVAYYEAVIDRMPHISDVLTVSTIPHRLHGYLGERNFLIKDTKGEVIVAADSMWVYMDTRNVKMMRIPDEVIEAYKPDMGERYDISPRGRRINMPEDMEYRTDFQIRKCDQDYNGHVNNTVYLDLMEEFIPPDETLCRARVSYKAPILYGDSIKAYTKRVGESLFISLANGEGEEAVAAEMGFK